MTVKWIADTLKKVGTIQNCQCLPEMVSYMVQFAISDVIKDTKDKIESRIEPMEKYPTMVERADSLIRNDPQYKKGLVTARDIYGDWGLSKLVIEELKDSLEAYEYLLKMIKTIPSCQREVKPSPMMKILMEKGIGGG